MGSVNNIEISTAVVVFTSMTSYTEVQSIDWPVIIIWVMIMAE